MPTILSHERQRAHAFLELLPEEQISAVSRLLESMLSPLDRKLALAPIDDEPLTRQESAAIQAGMDSLQRNGGVPMHAVLTDFGLTMDDFHKMAENDEPENP